MSETDGDGRANGGEPTGTGLVAFLRSKKPLTPSLLALVPVGSPYFLLHYLIPNHT